MKALSELAAEYREGARKISEHIIRLKAEKHSEQRYKRLINVLTAERNELTDTARHLEQHCRPIARYDPYSEEETVTPCPKGLTEVVNGVKYNVTAYINTRNRGVLPILDIPQMSDERWKELSNAQK